MKKLWIVNAVLAATLGLVASSGARAEETPAPGPAKQGTVGPNFVDNDGDGICDRYAARGGQARSGRGHGRGGNGPGDGTGNRGVGPKDGSGNGPGPGTGCDGTGPKGPGRRGGRRQPLAFDGSPATPEEVLRSGHPPGSIARGAGAPGAPLRQVLRARQPRRPGSRRQAASRCAS
jgi:hypothetical protein